MILIYETYGKKMRSVIEKSTDRIRAVPSFFALTLLILSDAIEHFKSAAAGWNVCKISEILFFLLKFFGYLRASD